MMHDNNLSKSVTEVCRSSYQKIFTHVARAKRAVQAQFKDLVADHEHALQLALNEAEALAWQTQYPELVFQDLAEEKARGVVNWVSHQRHVRSRHFSRT